MTNTSFEKPSDEAINKYNKAMRHFWHPVLPVSDLTDDKPVGIELLGEAVVLAKLNGEIVALQDLCRHFQARLSLGEIIEHDGQKRLMCIYHGWVYNNQGKCIHIPQLSPGRSIPGDAQVPRYLAKECHGLIWVCLEPEPKFDIPEFPELYDKTYRPGPLRVYEPWKASAPRIIMGALDDTHFPWLHEGILGTRDQTDPPDHVVWREGSYLISEYNIIQPPNFSTTDVSADSGNAEGKKITYTNYVGVPGVIRLVKKGEQGTRYTIWAATCPHKYNSTTTFWRVARNYDLDPAHDNDYETFEDKVRSQDKPVVESQRPWLLPPFWTKIELPLRPADLPLIEYQKWLEELDITVAV
jgi:phenylpropionate dioxygenase-like ring-hydroxylating dioxygenase large terminal subunit